MIVCVLNWETLGHPVAPPPQARVGYGYSEAQVDMLGRLERLVDFFLAAGDFDAGSLGRSVEKLDALLSVCRELPVSGQDVDLTELAAEVGAALDPYSNKHACSSSPRDESMAPPSGLVSDDLFAEGSCFRHMHTKVRRAHLLESNLIRLFLMVQGVPLNRLWLIGLNGSTPLLSIPLLS